MTQDVLSRVEMATVTMEMMVQVILEKQKGRLTEDPTPCYHHRGFCGPASGRGARGNSVDSKWWRF